MMVLYGFLGGVLWVLLREWWNNRQYRHIWTVEDEERLRFILMADYPQWKP